MRPHSTKADDAEHDATRRSPTAANEAWSRGAIGACRSASIRSGAVICVAGRAHAGADSSRADATGARESTSDGAGEHGEPNEIHHIRSLGALECP